MYGNNVYGGTILPWYRVNMLREALENKEVTLKLKEICKRAIVSSSISLAEAREEGEWYPDQQWENNERYEQRMEEIDFDEQIIRLSTKVLILCKKKGI